MSATHADLPEAHQLRLTSGHRGLWQIAGTPGLWVKSSTSNARLVTAKTRTITGKWLRATFQRDVNAEAEARQALKDT